MSDIDDVSPTDPIELARQAFEKALDIRYRQGYVAGQFDARDEMDIFLKGVIRSNTGYRSAREEFLLNTHVDDLVGAGELSVRTRNCLAGSLIFTIRAMVDESEENLLNISNFGQASLSEVHILLGKRGLALKKWHVSSGMVTCQGKAYTYVLLPWQGTPPSLTLNFSKCPYFNECVFVLTSWKQRKVRNNKLPQGNLSTKKTKITHLSTSS